MNSFFTAPPGVLLLDHLVQRTPAWHAWRNGQDLPDKKTRITATMAAIIDGDSITKSTPTQLWGELTGRRVAPAPSDYLKRLFARGTRMEPVARAAYEEFTGNRMLDICVQHPTHPWAGASLDGLSPSCDLILEIKCPISQRVHSLAKSGRIPSYYMPQVLWQLFCAPSAMEAHYWSWFPEDEGGQAGALVTISRDQAAQEALFNKCLKFRICLLDDTPPVEDAFRAAALTYRRAREDADYAASLLEQAETALKLALADQDLGEACGVRLTRYAVRGVTDYAKALLELGLPAEQLSASLEGFRKPAPVDYEAAWKALGQASNLDELTLQTLEAKYTGEPHTRHRLTLDKDWEPSPSDLSLPNELAESEAAELDWNW
jgi:putative phage-type endonuclease